ncbi:MAG: TRAP transporter substrate-binding protein DctP [Alphaproteobacteria bacterium]
MPITATQVHRRRFLAGTGALAAAFVSRGAAAAKVELTVAHGSPIRHVISAQGVEPWMARVKQLTNDEVAFKYFPAGQIAPLPELLASLQSGVADVVPVPVGYVSDKMPLNGVSMLPGLGTTSKAIVTAHARALAEKGPLADEFAVNKGVPFWVMAFPPYQIVSMAAPLRKLADFRGKVIRSAGGSMNLVIAALGGSPAEIPVGDMYVALERGTATATISALSSLKPYKVHEIMKAASTNGAFGTFVNIMACNTDKWAKLPADIQKAMVQAGRDVQASAAAFMDKEVGELRDEFAKMGKAMYEFSAEEAAAINGKLAGVHDDWTRRLDRRKLPASDVLARFRTLSAS